MTGNQINSFVGNLVEMAKAYEELPGVRQALAEAEFNSATLADTIAQREASILRLKAELEAAHEATRKVEAERDEAIGSFLAADDRADKILAFVKTTFGNAGALIQAVEPAQPQADIEPIPPTLPAIDNPLYGDPMAEAPLHAVPQGESALGEPNAPSGFTSHPIASSLTVDGSANVSHEPLAYEPAPEVAPTPTPTPAPSAPTGTGTESDRSSYDGASPDAIQPYAGRYYIDVPGWISLSDWLAAGGTEADYYFRR